MRVVEFLFSCSTRYLTSERSEVVRYQVEHEKRNSISTSSLALFYLLYKHTNDDFLAIFLEFHWCLYTKYIYFIAEHNYL